MGKKKDFSDFECGLKILERVACVNISDTADLLGFSCSSGSCGSKFLVDVRGQRRMARLVQDDRNATVSRIATCYNKGMQNAILECTTCGKILNCLMLPCHHGPKSLKNFYKTSLKVLYEELHQRVPVRAPDLSSTSIFSSCRGKRRAIHSYLC
uniref:Uncharacterized protein n=1 Tax=Takifugu rubripes TaxID=31033 RepID=A0A674NLN9_TAKRU